jgi:hypothetical protein
MVPSELQHPRVGHGRRTDERDVVLIRAEGHRAATASAASAACLSTTRRSVPSRSIAQHIVALHDLGHLAIARGAEGGFE